MKYDIQRVLKKQAFLDTCRLYEERFEENYCSLIPMKKKMRSETWYYEYPFSFTEEDFILDGKMVSFM
jgi:hypothetical protein